MPARKPKPRSKSSQRKPRRTSGLRVAGVDITNAFDVGGWGIPTSNPKPKRKKR